MDTSHRRDKVEVILLKVLLDIVADKKRTDELPSVVLS